eukprot:m.81767 g.81767  ORF g.81767 m.81767 type:complete len:198 (+) comp14703_c0_seq5:380-973(+)
MATSGEQGAADSNELSFLSLPAALRQAAIAAGCGQQARDQLQQAITALDTAQVQETLAAHPDVATCDLDFNGTRSLHVVSELSALADTLPAFCQPSAINTQDGVGCTPLHCAAQTGNHEAIAVLLKAGADSSMVNCMCQTPLQVTSSKYAMKPLFLHTRNRAKRASEQTRALYQTYTNFTTDVHELRTRGLHNGPAR